MRDFYDEDLTYIHHEGFGEFARQAGEQLLPILRDQGIEEGLVVDLGCGSGIWSGMLVGAGYRVIGVDVSPHMIAAARVNAPGASFQQASAYDFQIPTCNAITALGEVLGYGNEQLPGINQVARLFQSAASSLPVGGLLVFDVIVDSAADTMDYSAWQKDRDWAVLVDSREDRKHSRLTRGITGFREVNGHYRRSEETHIVRIFNVEQLQELLQAAGFRVTVSDSYGGYQLAKRRRAFLAIRI